MLGVFSRPYLKKSFTGFSRGPIFGVYAYEPWNLLESAVSSTNPKYWTASYQHNRYGLEKIASTGCIPCSKQSQAPLTPENGTCDARIDDPRPRGAGAGHSFTGPAKDPLHGGPQQVRMLRPLSNSHKMIYRLTAVK